EQQVGAFPGLHILEGDVIEFVPCAVRMPDILEHLARRRADIDFVRLAPDRRHQAPGLREGAIAGRETWHRIRAHVAARIAEAIDRLRADQQRLGGVDPARDPDYDALDT